MKIGKNSVNAVSKGRLLQKIRSKRFQTFFLMFLNVKCFPVTCQLLLNCQFQRVGILVALQAKYLKTLAINEEISKYPISV